jgi:hypothetical protein
MADRYLINRRTLQTPVQGCAPHQPEARMPTPLNAAGHAWARVADSFLDAYQQPGLEDETRDLFRRGYVAAARLVDRRTEPHLQPEARRLLDEVLLVARQTHRHSAAD